MSEREPQDACCRCRHCGDRIEAAADGTYVDSDGGTGCLPYWEHGVFRHRHEPFPRRQTLAEAVAALIAAIEADPDAEPGISSLMPWITRAIPAPDEPELAGPGDGRNWWYGVVEDHCTPYLEYGMSYEAAIGALRRAERAAMML